MKKILFLLIAISFVFAGCASAPKKEKETGNKSQEVSETKYEEMLAEGNKMLREGKAKESVEKFDQVISYYENRYKNSTAIVFCARTRNETAAYVAMNLASGKDIVVESSTWGDALFSKAYAKIELKNFEEAKMLLNQAIKLSPFNSSNLSEIGHIYQLEKNWKNTLEIFKNAVEYAKEYTPEQMREYELTRAMRGVGYSLIEMGKLDEAEKIYIECLKINKDDKTAMQELMYIKKLKESKEPQESQE